MCGIAGHVHFEGPVELEPIQLMIQRMRHRGPDDQGILCTKDGKCVFGHTRLSIIDLSPAGHQPMTDPETGNMIVFNGEIYNFLERRKECERDGYRFQSHTDTEVILALYRRYGVVCLSRLRGMFAFAIWNPSQEQLFLARDRVGKKPLHYALPQGGLIFASEIDPLARFPGLERSEDPEALELYLQLQYIPAPWTIYKTIRKLPPAHYALFDRDGLRVEQYWNIDYRPKVRMTEEDALDGFDEKLTEAVRLRMISDVPLGALLSGGVDSSVIVAMMAKLSGSPIRTFNIGFYDEKFDESAYARQAAEICKTMHHQDMADGNIQATLPVLVRHYGEPYADSSAMPSFLVCEAARRHVTVALNGDGGDELLSGYKRYWASSFQQWLGNIPLSNGSVRTLIDRMEHLTGRADWRSRISRKLLQTLFRMYAHHGWRFTLMYRDFWNDDVRARLMDLPSVTDLLQQWSTQWLTKAENLADNPTDRLLWLDHHTYLPDDLLVKMDIASMHCSLETRSPLLDHEVIEYCAALPVKFKVRDRDGKYLLKKLATRYFPPQFVYRKKMGFSVPLAAWLRGPLREVLEDVLRDPAAMAPLNVQLIEDTLKAFFLQQGHHASRLWVLLMFGMWRRSAEGAWG